MKQSQQITSPILFIKKQSNIITINKGKDQNSFITNNCFDAQRETKYIYRSRFHSEATQSKLFDENNYFDKHQHSDMFSQSKQKGQDQQYSHIEDEISNLFDNPNIKQTFDSFNQSDELSSDHENSQTKSFKKFCPGQFNFAEKKIKSTNVKNTQDKLLIINSKKQKYNNNYIYLSDSEGLKEQIIKYQMSIEKLKQQNVRLMSQKMKMSSTTESMKLIEVRLELQALKKQIKMLENEKDMHLTINSIYTKEEKKEQNVFMTVSCLQMKTYERQEQSSGKKKVSKFNNNLHNIRNNNQQIFNQNRQQIKIVNSINSHLSQLETVFQQKSDRYTNGVTNSHNYQLLQNIKNPYFLKRY